MSSSSESRAGYRVYTPTVLRVYDFWVHGVSNPFFWKFRTREIHDLYRANLSARHLELGVGTGLFLSRGARTCEFERLAIADANPACLEYSKRRLEQVVDCPVESMSLDLCAHPERLEADDVYDSIGLNFVLHCLPAGGGKRHALAHAALRLSPMGVCFGTTLLGAPPSRSFTTRWLEHRYQERGIFGNHADSRATWQAHLEQVFGEVRLWESGRALFFVARNRRS